MRSEVSGVGAGDEIRHGKVVDDVAATAGVGPCVEGVRGARVGARVGGDGDKVGDGGAARNGDVGHGGDADGGHKKLARAARPGRHEVIVDSGPTAVKRGPNPSDSASAAGSKLRARIV